MIRLEDVRKIYKTQRGEVASLDGISLDVAEGEFVVVRGSSGSGKTTLLLTLGGMLRPTSGKVEVAGSSVYSLDPSARAAFRGENIGFVFQMFHLIPYLNVLENVRIAKGNGAAAGPKEAEEMLVRFGLGDRLTHTPAELSAGERQRTALARALLRDPKVLLADEPTGNLDPENAESVVHYMKDFNERGGTVVVVTHGDIADPHANRIVELNAGKIVS